MHFIVMCIDILQIFCGHIVFYNFGLGVIIDFVFWLPRAAPTKFKRIHTVNA